MFVEKPRGKILRTEFKGTARYQKNLAIKDIQDGVDNKGEKWGFSVIEGGEEIFTLNVEKLSYKRGKEIEHDLRVLGMACGLRENIYGELQLYLTGEDKRIFSKYFPLLIPEWKAYAGEPESNIIEYIPSK